MSQNFNERPRHFLDAPLPGIKSARQSHWSDRYVGLPYSNADCAMLAAIVQREVFNRNIALPSARVAGLRGQTRQIEQLKDDYGVLTTEPQEGDAVLLVCRGRLAHVGIYCVIGDVVYVLHAMRNAGHAVRHRLCDLHLVGLTVEGFYRWR